MLAVQEVLEIMDKCESYKLGLYAGISLMSIADPQGTWNEWEVDYIDISSDYRLLVTAIKQSQLIK